MAGSAQGIRARLSTVRAKTTAAATIIVAAALVVGGVLTVVVLRHTLVNNVDDAARRRAQDVAELVQEGSLPRVLSAAGEQAAIVQVVDAKGDVVASTANFAGGRPILGRPDGAVRGRVHTVSNLPVRDEQDDDFRVVSTVVDSGAGPLAVNAGESMETVYEGVAAVRRILLIGLPVMLVLVGVTTAYVVGRALRPVDAIRREVADISAHDLSRRVPQPAADDEVGRLAETMNAMLDRLESFTERQRRFVADASHELQSPLASSLADLEVAMAAADQDRWKETAAGVAADTQRMTKLVQDLLFLARADDVAADAPRTLVDLDDVVLSEVARLRSRTPLSVDTSGVRPMEVRGDPDQLARVVRNLLENAGRYARSVVTVDLVANGDTARMTVTDDGPGVPDGLRPRVFDRFTRADDSRSRDTGGTGLGLAIAREIVERHGGSIALAPDGAGAGAQFEVRIPAG
jgi:signal transduction histidine kinase